MRRRVMRSDGHGIVAAMVVPQAAAGAMTMIVRSSICGLLPLLMALSASPVAATGAFAASAVTASAPGERGLHGTSHTNHTSGATGEISEAGVEDEFFVLASVQAVPMGGGTMVVKLAASGPIAWQRLSDGEAPGGVAGRIRVRLFGVNRSEPGALTVTEAGSVAATPDGHGNLDITLVATGPLATQPLRVRQGRTANEIELLAAAPGGAGTP